jgi:MFS superfamily sulfate permease-like transporter
MHIPAGLAYGALTSLNPVNGIYTSFFTGLTYVLFGTSRHLSVGTYAVISLMVYSAISRVEQKYALEHVESILRSSILNTTITTQQNKFLLDDVNYNFKLKISSSLAFWCGIFQVNF